MPDDHEKTGLGENHHSQQSTMDDSCNCGSESDTHYHHHYHPGQHRFIITSFGKSKFSNIYIYI